ncbi:MAG: cell wall-associated NlpC family hydrolase [Glaciecola sp.]|jgi:cell wall-associated NlpC family hydrolase
MQKQTLMLLLVLFVSGVSLAQQTDKVAIKLDRYYESRPEKCIKKCKKYIKKRKHKKMAYYYLGLSQYKAYEVSSKDRDLLKSLTSLRHYYRSKGESELIADTIQLALIQAKFESVINNKIKKEQCPIARRYAKKYKQIYKKDIGKIALLRVPKKVTTTPVVTAAITEVKKATVLNTVNLMRTAKSLIGVKYKIGGESARGLDCSGFNKYVYGKENVKLPHSAAAQSKLGSLVPISKCKTGDMIFFGSKKVKGYKIQHTGLVYANKDGELKIIHCPNSGVCIEGSGDTSWEMYWKKRLLFVKRLNDKDIKTL